MWLRRVERSEAAALLDGQDDGTFLIRPKEHGIHCLSIVYVTTASIHAVHLISVSMSLSIFLGHRLGDDLVDWNSGVSVCPSVPTSTKSFSDFHLIRCVGRPRPHMHTNMTSTRSKVKVKVTELPKLRKVHFSRSISSAFLAWSSKLMVGGHSM